MDFFYSKSACMAESSMEKDDHSLKLESTESSSSRIESKPVGMCSPRGSAGSDSYADEPADAYGCLVQSQKTPHSAPVDLTDTLQSLDPAVAYNLPAGSIVQQHLQCMVRF